jgi:dTDP-4-amino-4,6-dideoxygalactose transaminase
MSIPSMDRIPLVDLAWQHTQVRDVVAAGFDRVLSRTAFVLGPDVTEFEQRYAQSAGVKHCVGVANGTDAVELALRVVGIGPGDEVIVPTNSFIATALAVARAGAKPVLVDCDAVYHLIDPAAVERAITPRTRAIVPVHLFGQIAPSEALEKIAAMRGLHLVEDAAQSQGARRNGRTSGAFGVTAATSFFPGKNLGAYGDAGAVTTNDDALAGKLRALRNYGSDRKYHHPETGFNTRLDTLQAVVLNAKLAHLARWNDMRREAAARYDSMLQSIDVERPATLPGNEHVFHLYVIRVPHHDRDAVLAKLHGAAVEAGIHYPSPIHLTGAFAHLGLGPGSFPVAEKLAKQMISLPMFPGITPAQQERVVGTLVSALHG